MTETAVLPLLVTMPHCSGAVPEEIFAQMRGCGESDVALRRRIFSEGDPFTDQLYDLPGAVKIPAATSRFVVDLNRARDEAGPNGVIKTTDFQLRPLYAPGYRLTPEAREVRLKQYYDPFHRDIANTLATGKIRFLLDGHSFSAQGPALGPDTNQSRPALCLGNFGDAEGNPVGAEPTSLDPALARATRDYAVTLLRPAFPEWPVQRLACLNDPFDGGHIVRQYSLPSTPNHVPGMLFEVNRAHYLNEETLEPIPGRMDLWRNLISSLAGFLLERL